MVKTRTMHNRCQKQVEFLCPALFIHSQIPSLVDYVQYTTHTLASTNGLRAVFVVTSCALQTSIHALSNKINSWRSLQCPITSNNTFHCLQFISKKEINTQCWYE